MPRVTRMLAGSQFVKTRYDMFIDFHAVPPNDPKKHIVPSFCFTLLEHGE